VKAKRKGVTLIEVIVATTILMGVLGMTYLMLHTSTNEYANQSVHVALDERARDLLADITRELHNAKHPPTTTMFLVSGDPDFDAAVPRAIDLNFNTISRFDYAASKPVFGNAVRYWWELDIGEGTVRDGKDNNRNGLVDEGVIKKTETFEGKPPVTTEVCRDVAYKGLRFRLGDHTVMVTLELQRRDARNTLVTRKAEMTTDLRN
jgi:hypothetical protein